MDKESDEVKPTLHSVKIDRTAFSVGPVLEPSDDKAYWLSKTPQERLQAAGLMRRLRSSVPPNS